MNPPGPYGSPPPPYGQPGGYGPPRGYPAPAPAPPAITEDESYLNTLSILHYVYAAFLGVLGLGACAYLIFGLYMATVMPVPAGRVFGGFFAAIGAFAMGVTWTKGGLVLYSGYCLAKRKSHTLCFVVACISCIAVPLGTALGVFTLVTLSKPTVKARFGVV